MKYKVTIAANVRYHKEIIADDVEEAKAKAEELFAEDNDINNFEFTEDWYVQDVRDKSGKYIYSI